MIIQNECVQIGCVCADFSQVMDNFDACINPLECVGIAHHEGIKHLEGVEVLSGFDNSYRLVNSFLSSRFDMDASEFLPFARIGGNLMEVVHEGIHHYTRMIENANGPEKEVLENLQSILLTVTSQIDFEKELSGLVISVLGMVGLAHQEVLKLLGLIAISKFAVMYMDANSPSNFFGESLVTRLERSFWADLAGFELGFVDSVAFNNDGGASNPISSGLATAILVSNETRA